MAENVILAETALDGFTLDETYGSYRLDVNPSPFTLVGGETYTVHWDGVSYICTTQTIDGFAGLMLGNAASIGGSGNGEPFFIGWSESGVTFLASDDATSHTIAIYQAVDDGTTGEETPEGIVLKDRNGNDVAYYGIETVTFDATTEGKQQVYTKGEAVEGLEIVPDFSGGDASVTAAEGTLVRSATIRKPETQVPENIRNGVNISGVTGTFIGDTEEATAELSMADGDQVILPSADGRVLSQVTITKPETLIPENIAEGVDIAGVIGTLAAGGANVKFASGTFTGNGGNGASVIVEHGLGVAPDIIFVTKNARTVDSSVKYIDMVFAMSTAIKQALGAGSAQYYVQSSKYSGNANYSALTVGSTNAGIENSSGVMAIIYGATETSFAAGNTQNLDMWEMEPDVTYIWFAIGGLAEISE